MALNQGRSQAPWPDEGNRLRFCITGRNYPATFSAPPAERGLYVKMVLSINVPKARRAWPLPHPIASPSCGASASRRPCARQGSSVAAARRCLLSGIILARAGHRRDFRPRHRDPRFPEIRNPCPGRHHRTQERGCGAVRCGFRKVGEGETSDSNDTRTKPNQMVENCDQSRNKTRP